MNKKSLNPQIKFICNAFSLQMLDLNAACSVEIRPVSLSEARELAKGAESAVGHPDTASVFTSQLNTPVPMNRISVQLSSGDSILVGQLVGGRLPEGATQLPDGFAIKWLLVSIREVA